MPTRTFSFILSLSVLYTAVPSFAQALSCPPPGQGTPPPNLVTAKVVALNQPIMLNRLGAAIPQGMVFALEKDVVGDATQGWMLRPDKRPRPMVLRVRQGDCLQITLTNRLPATPPSPSSPIPPPLATVTNQVSLHVQGLEIVNSNDDDGTFVGQNATSGLIEPGKTKTYTLYAAQIGAYLLYSASSTFGGGGNGGGQITNGLFGAVNVEPASSEFYRSQVTRDDLLRYATKKDGQGQPMFTPAGQPLIDYDAHYPAAHPRSCQPVLRMVDTPWVPNPGGGCGPGPVGRPLETFHTDLTAIITGPNHGRFTGSGPEFDPIPASPDRRQPFREFTIHYHEVLDAVQAFDIFYPPPGKNPPPNMANVLAPGKDNFAINYATGGIAAEILANRFNVGPNAGPPGSTTSSCVDCKFEEFFLSAWAVGDPGMVVDIPANAPQLQPDQPNQVSALTRQYTQCQAKNDNSCSPPTPRPGRKATKAFYPDDPSNVYHSYLSDHTIFRILHAGGNFTHVHHQHAHQWLHSPNNPNGSYLDSQMISPGAAFTLEMVYNGSGNRNKTVGDSIFHCHFYPHFASGMWGMWRVHDVFEAGTALDGNGRPSPVARALPDGEIAAGTPIPALVPLPTMAMAPVPSRVNVVPVCTPGLSTACTPQNAAGFRAAVLPEPNGSYRNPGYPFFIPGVAGHRAPHPPLDFACETDSYGKKVCYDGGLPRHIVLGGTEDNERHNQWDFTKDNLHLLAQQLPEEGTPIEQVAMAYHGTRKHPSYVPGGGPGTFLTNGLPRKTPSNPTGAQPGAPFADPAVDDNGGAIGTMRRYKAANVQMDVTFNKKGWHYPQQRFITLWEDIAPTFDGSRAPEPFFFRANSKDDFIEFWQTNLVPSYYELDDFQVRTPTDVLGQHIHLVKFDVTSSDGAGNGFNYEDGTFSPEEVRDRILAIRAQNHCTPNDRDDGTFRCPVAKPSPFLPPAPPGQNWLGAQTTVQRWYADMLQGCVDGTTINCSPNGDRTLRTVFTHDHFSPSTHQQAGLYAGLLVEPQGSTWTDPITGVKMGTRGDGGPTGWQANIAYPTPQGADAYREFALEFQDVALAYSKNSIPPSGFKPYPHPAPDPIITGTPVFGWSDCSNAINPSGGCGSPFKTNPVLFTAGQMIGSMTVNYRNEPLPLRVNRTPTPVAPKPHPNATDLSHVFESIVRTDKDLNAQPSNCFDGSAPPCKDSFKFPGPFPGAQPTDPYTPLLQAYQGDKVQVRVLVGGYLFNHNFAMQGVKWLFEPSNALSGYRDNQAMGISEHFEFLFMVPNSPTPKTTLPGRLPFADYLYETGAGVGDLGQGSWGILRAYNTGGNTGKLMPNLKPLPNNPFGGRTVTGSMSCPPGQTPRQYYVAAISPSGQIVYNDRDTNLVANTQPLLWVPADASGKPLTTAPKDPLVLRAGAGECIQVTLFNRFVESNTVFTTPDGNLGFSNQPWSAVQIFPSTHVGMHAQMVSTDTTINNGVNVGFNHHQYGSYTTATPGNSITYTWYAGNLRTNPNGQGVTGIPIELGSVNLLASDPIEQQPHALIGSLIIEPAGSIWCKADRTVCSGAMFNAKIGDVYDTTADLYAPGPPRLLFREFVAMVQDEVYLGQSGVFNSVNFGTEPMSLRFATAPGKPFNQDFNSVDLSSAFSNFMQNLSTNKVQGEPKTPIFTATAGMPVRFRMLHPDGNGGFPDNVFVLDGHVWQEEPYRNDAAGNASAVIGFNRTSQWMGSRDGFGAGNHFDLVIARAGGVNERPGDYLYKSYPAQEGPLGIWGVFRVQPKTVKAALAVRPLVKLAPARRVQVPAREDPGERFFSPRQRSRSDSPD